MRNPYNGDNAEPIQEISYLRQILLLLVACPSRTIMAVSDSVHRRMVVQFHQTPLTTQDSVDVSSWGSRRLFSRSLRMRTIYGFLWTGRDNISEPFCSIHIRTTP